MDADPLVAQLVDAVGRAIAADHTGNHRELRMAELRAFYYAYESDRRLQDVITYQNAAIRASDRADAALRILTQSRQVVAAWLALGRCEDEFLPKQPEACAEYHQALDQAIERLRRQVEEHDD